MMYLVDQSKTVRTNIFAKNKFAITNTIFVESIISDMHNRITYMYINFHQNWENL